MYQHVSLSRLTEDLHGQPLLVGGRLQRHVLGNTLWSGSHALQLVGEPFDWLPPHGARLEVWGVLLSSRPPSLLVHGARPLGSGAPIPAASLPSVGFLHLRARVTRHASELIACTAQHHAYLLRWPDGQEGVYDLEGQVSGLSPPWLEVLSARPVVPAPVPRSSP